LIFVFVDVCSLSCARYPETAEEPFPPNMDLFELPRGISIYGA
jgi:hypothetical protein